METVVLLLVEVNQLQAAFHLSTVLVFPCDQHAILQQAVLFFVALDQALGTVVRLDLVQGLLVDLCGQPWVQTPQRRHDLPGQNGFPFGEAAQQAVSAKVFLLEGVGVLPAQFLLQKTGGRILQRVFGVVSAAHRGLGRRENDRSKPG